MIKTNLYAYDDILLEDIHSDREPDYIYANPSIYDIESNYKVVVNEEGSQLELIDNSNGYLRSIYVSTDMELIRHIENILEIHIKNKENEAKAKAFDRITDVMNVAEKTMHKKESLAQYAAINAFWNIEDIIKEYERSEQNGS